MSNNKNIFVISYYAGIPGACQAEWLDDKIDSLLKLGCNVTILTAVCAHKYHDKKVSHFRVPSLSPKDFLDEIERLKGLKEPIPLISIISAPFVFTFGYLIDGLQILLTKGTGEGRWSWTAPAFLASFVIALLKKQDIILTTGGPASAHLAGILTSKIIRKPVIVELQDPLSGGDIGRNVQAAGLLYKVEKIIVEYADKVVYVTKAAAIFAKNQFKANNVFAVYPGAKDFHVKPKAYGINEASNEDKKFQLVHLGSLYANRDFKAITHAIDSLITTGKIVEKNITLINLGHVSPNITEDISKKSYVKILPPVSRVEALKFAAQCDVTLLIQNSDERSKVTIPYKTYDYLNIGNKLLGLLNSDELTDLLINYGHTAVPLKNIDMITTQLELLLEKRNVMTQDRLQIDPVHQASELISLNITTN